MKPYLESIRKLARVGLILFALSLVASAVVTIQYCAAPYHYNAPSITQMFSPLIVFIYLGGVVLAMDGFSFLNKRSDSDFYHSLPVSRKKLFWAISLAALTWVAATVLGSVLGFDHHPFTGPRRLLCSSMRLSRCRSSRLRP